jgi:ribosomal protein S18 acetylase RimI-like enzyme
MEINHVSPSDAVRYLEALNKLIVTTIKLPDTAIQHYLNQWTVERIKSCLDSWVFIEARDQDKLEGIVLGTPVEGGVGTIIWLLVSDNNQRQGTGSILFEEACRVYKGKGAHKVKLTVPDEATTGFYIKQGMILEGLHKNHWWNCDFWAMGIQL